MDDPYIRWISEGLAVKGKTQRGLARALGVSHPQITDLLRNKRRVRLDELDRIAAYLGRPPPTKLIAIVGYIGAGQEVLAVDDHAQGAGLEYVAAPPGAGPKAVAVRVRGDSMWPRYDDGDLLVYEQNDIPPSELIGSECIVKTKDGRMFVKRLRRGRDDLTFNLESYNAPLIEGVNLQWAALIVWVKRAN